MDGTGEWIAWTNSFCAEARPARRNFSEGGRSQRFAEKRNAPIHRRTQIGADGRNCIARHSLPIIPLTNNRH